MKNKIASVLIAASMSAAMLFSSMPVHAAEWTEEMNYDSNKAFEYIMDKTFDDGIERNNSEYIDHSDDTEHMISSDVEFDWSSLCVGTVENNSSSSTESSTQATTQTQEASATQPSTQESAAPAASASQQSSTPASGQESASVSQSTTQESSTPASGQESASVSQSTTQESSTASSGSSTTTESSTQTGASTTSQATTQAAASAATGKLASAVKITDKEVLKSYPFGAMTVTSPAGVVFTEAVGADGYSFNVFSGKTLVNQALILNAAGAPVKISSPELINVDGKMYINIKAESAASVFATNEQKHAFALYGISGFASNGKVFETFK